MGTVLQVNVGVPQRVRINGVDVDTAIVKQAVDHPVLLADDHAAGDVQADADNHGGPWHAVYAYARESYDAWEVDLGRDLPNGFFGENLTVSGVEADAPVVGEQWQVGGARLAVAGPRIPCRKLGWRMGDPAFVARFLHDCRTGSYLRIVDPGEVRAGDTVEVVDRPDHGVTVVDVLRLWRGEREVAAHVLGAGPMLHPEVLARARAAT